MVKRKIGVTH